MAENVQDKVVLEKRRKTELVLSNIYNLPSMSEIMLEVSKLLDNPNTNTALLSKKIGKDPGLATKILSIANSPLYGLPRKVSTIDFAILIIGYQDIKNIVIALSMIESFKNKSDKYLEQKEFWLHSLLCGNASKRIAEDLGYRFGGEAFVTGLLHDLGVPVMHKYFHTPFLEIYNRVINNVYCLDAEKEILGYTHQEMGKFLTNKWNLPSHLCDSINNHHHPSLATENQVLAAIVHLADYMTQKFNIGAFYWDKNYKLDEGILEILKFKGMDELEKFISNYGTLFEEEIKTIKV
ncbi:MAG TPA: HDOD domain-containing protein [Melioribacteraceae bacterium]|nr:HDOD domain-containing protein [Melioribacteraceae bacterium]